MQFRLLAVFSPKLSKLLLAGVSISAAFASSSFEGTVQGPSANVIDAANVTLWNTESQSGVRTSTSNGRFVIGTLAAGDYLFEVDKSGYLPVYGAVHISGEGSHEVSVAMRGNPGGNDDSAAAPLRKINRPLRNATTPPVVKPAQVISKLSPLYPQSERKAGVRGLVRIAMIILPSGAVDDLVVISAPDGGLAKAALTAVQQWRYSPTYLDGQAVEANLTVDVNFRN